MKRIAIFASGSGTNAENIIKYFANSQAIKIALILSNKADAFVIERAKKYQIETYVLGKSEFYESNKVLNMLRDRKIDHIVLAGFLWLIPSDLIGEYPRKILNIHPALLPKYGGKGMYGMKVHEAVLLNGEAESGITIHEVNEHYDKGEIIYQAVCKIEPVDTPDSLANKVHALEYVHFPKIIEQWILKTATN